MSCQMKHVVKRRNNFGRQHNKGGAVPKTRNRKEMNPLDKNCQISRCVVCDSKMHWAKDCSHSKNIKQQSAKLMSVRLMVNKLIIIDMKHVS